MAPGVPMAALLATSATSGSRPRASTASYRARLLRKWLYRLAWFLRRVPAAMSRMETAAYPRSEKRRSAASRMRSRVEGASIASVVTPCAFICLSYPLPNQYDRGSPRSHSAT